MKVDFFIIGPPRCGSTSLSYYLAQHPEVCFAHPKEPSFFSSDLEVGYENLPLSVEDYHFKYYPHYDSTKHAIVGEGSPIYLYSKVALEKIYSYNPNAKLIALARHPIELAYSMHSARYRVGNRHENIGDFEEAWRAQSDRLAGLRMPKDVIRKDLLQYGKLAMLGSQYERMFSIFPTSQIHVVFLEDLRENSRITYEKITEFLNIESKSEFIDFSAKEINTAWRSKILKKIYESGISFSKCIPLNTKFGLLGKLRSKSLVTAKRKPLRPEFLSELLAHFDGEIDKLSRLTGRDLSHWKDPKL